MDPEKIITVKDMILILFYSCKEIPIFGRIMFFKELFLLYEEILKNEKNLEVQKPEFKPYNYGPYSFDVADILEQLEWNEIIKRRGIKNRKTESFRLTEKGMLEIEEKFEKLNPELKEKIRSLRRGCDELGTDGILNYVYLNYPDYKEKSKIKNRYKEIIWGQGKG
ncbi:uncharacterized protein YwgA [Methanococcus maripaludis]|uniref:Uncharacterized protein YwgA n=1 Tax=Methanococcus maripaludis TaxID=39152 RepID=A0A7J9P692_METMI|nr:hypothetical protein [Methanococcus maripaludis]MBA2858284.1 uncharacterized protein YwgA [Methanococcus maripaludis]